MTLDEAAELRQRDPKGYLERSLDSIARHVRRHAGAAEAGRGDLRLRQQHPHHGHQARGEERLRHPRLRARVHPPAVLRRARTVPLGGAFRRSRDIYRTDELALEIFPENETLSRWIALARQRIQFQGLPARICWLGYGERAEFGLAINRPGANGQVEGAHRDRAATIWTAARWPRRTAKPKAMRDGSDAIADWPLLNALLNTASGASWVSIHNGGGVGIGYSQHAGR